MAQSLFMFLRNVLLADDAANGKLPALRQFARRHQISIPKSHDLTDWKWEEGEWLHVFKLINDVTLRPCPRCGGSGEIEIH